MFVLDTNAVSEVIKKKPDSAFMDALHGCKADDLYTTTITVMELRYGAMRRSNKKEFWNKLQESIVSRYSILSFGQEEAIMTGDLLSFLAERGELIELEDAMIAAIALSHRFVLVTRNERHFRRIPKLKIENWWNV